MFIFHFGVFSFQNGNVFAKFWLKNSKNRPQNQGFPSSIILIYKIVDFGFEMNTRELFVIEIRRKRSRSLLLTHLKFNDKPELVLKVDLGEKVWLENCWTLMICFEMEISLLNG